MFGVEEFDAIINPPQAGILAVGAAVRTPVVGEGDTLEIASVLSAGAVGRPPARRRHGRGPVARPAQGAARRPDADRGLSECGRRSSRHAGTSRCGRSSRGPARWPPCPRCSTASFPIAELALVVDGTPRPTATGRCAARRRRRRPRGCCPPGPIRTVTAVGGEHGPVLDEATVAAGPRRGAGCVAAARRRLGHGDRPGQAGRGRARRAGRRRADRGVGQRLRRLAVGARAQRRQTDRAEHLAAARWSSITTCCAAPRTA